jgi:hypothetical protein
MSNYPESGAQGYPAALDQVISERLDGLGRVVTVGECGFGTPKTIWGAEASPSRLSYDQLHFSDAGRHFSEAFDLKSL